MCVYIRSYTPMSYACVWCVSVCVCRCACASGWEQLSVKRLPLRMLN